MKLLFTITIYCFFILTNLYAQNEPSGNDKFSNTNNFLDFESFRNNTGIGIELGYKGEVFSNIAGGFNNKSVYLDNFDIIFDFDLQHILNWNGARLNAYILGNHGGDPSEYAGAAQGISNIASYQTWKLYQFWFEQNLLDNNLSILFGLYDLNSEFDTRETSSIFINPSHGIGPEFSLTGENGPSIFPTTSLAIRTKFNISNSFDFKGAVFDGIPGDPNKPGGTHILLHSNDGVLLTGEVTYHSESEELSSGYFKISAGAWIYSGDFDKLNITDINGNPAMQKGNSGAYLSAEKFLFGEDGSQVEGLSAFVRLGFADKTVNQVQNYFGAGLHYTGMIPGREEDVIGFAVSTIRNSDGYINYMRQDNLVVEDYEHIFELTYIFNVNSWLQIQPDFQFVIHPANCDCSKTSLAYGTRLIVGI